jgi:hypothetical protein
MVGLFPLFGMPSLRPLRLRLALGLFSFAIFVPLGFGLTPAEVDALSTKAASGNAIAQYTLGLALADPREAAYEPAQAYVWLSLASLNGTNSKALAALTQQLSPAHLAEGKRRLEAVIANPVSAAISPLPANAHPPGPSSPLVERAAANPAADPEKLGAELAAARREGELVKAELTAQLADTRKRIAIAEAALESKDREIALLAARLSDLNRTLAGSSRPAPVPPATLAADLSAERDSLRLATGASANELADLRSKSVRATFELNAVRETLERLTADLATARRAQALAEAELTTFKAAAPSTGPAAIPSGVEARSAGQSSVPTLSPAREQPSASPSPAAATASPTP